MAVDWAQRLLNEPGWVALDSETTGLGRAGSRDTVPQFIELAIVEYDGSPDGNVLMDTRLRPSIPIEAGAQKVHGIHQEDLLTSPAFSDVHGLLSEILAHRRIVVYNAAFDRRIYASQLRKAKLEDAPLHPNADHRYPWECAMFWYARYRAELENGEFNHGRRRRFKRHKLPGGHHGALGDARATVRLVTDMARTPATQNTVAKETTQ